MIKYDCGRYVLTEINIWGICEGGGPDSKKPWQSCQTLTVTRSINSQWSKVPTAECPSRAP